MRKRQGTQRQAHATNTSGRREWLIVMAILAISLAGITVYRSLPSGRDRPAQRRPEPSSDDLVTISDPQPSVDSSSRTRPGPQVTEPSVPQTHAQLLADMALMAARAVARFPRDPMAYDLQGRVFMYQGKAAKAAAAWKQCLELESRRPDALHGLAQLAIKRGDDAAAEPLLRRALEIDPKYPQVACQLAEVLTRRQQVEEAASVLKDYVRLVPSSAESILQLAQIQLQLSEYADARTNFQRVLKIKPASSEAYLGLGTALVRLGHRDEARTYLEKSRTLRAKKPPAPSGMTPEVFDITMTRVNFASSSVYAAQLYQAHGALAEAVRLCQRAVDADPKNLPSRLLLITLYQQMHKLPDAILACEQTVAADPENPKLVWRLGVLYAAAGRFDAATSALKKVISLAPDTARAYAGLAEVYLESRQQPAESLRLAREAVRRDPSALHYVLLGRIYFQAGDLPNARKAVGEALKLEPDNATFRQMYDQLPAAQPRGR